MEGIQGLGEIPGIGDIFAARLHDDLGIETLEELEVAAHDGRLKSYPGIGAKRLAGIRDSLAQRLRRVRREPAASPPRQPPVSELLDVDREYREKAAAGILTKVAPRRFNPKREAWLPNSPHRAEAASLHRGFSNTARAHELGKTHDWVVLFCDNGVTEDRFTVITSEVGPLQGERIVVGRRSEMREILSARGHAGSRAAASR